MRFNELTEEPIRDDGSLSIIKAFVDFACDRIGLDRPPKIKLIRDPKLASERRSFGGYMPGGGIEITIGNRHIMDVLRTLAHEMVHHKQDVDGRLHDGSGKDGSEHENEANAKAAVVMRLWGKMNPELFQKAALLAESWIRQSKRLLEVREEVDFEQMQPQNIVAVAQQAFAQLYPDVKLYGKAVVEGVGLTTHKGGEGSASAFAGSDTKRGAFYLTVNAYAEGESTIVVVEDATAGEYKGAATAIIKSLFEAGERLYKTENRELVVNDNANSEAWNAIASRVGAEMAE